jgi:protein-disulfide isomerase
MHGFRKNDTRGGERYSGWKKLWYRGTPTFFINGIRLVGAQPYANFQQIIEQELKT